MMLVSSAKLLTVEYFNEYHGSFIYIKETIMALRWTLEVHHI